MPIATGVNIKKRGATALKQLIKGGGGDRSSITIKSKRCGGWACFYSTHKINNVMDTINSVSHLIERVSLVLVNNGVAASVIVPEDKIGETLADFQTQTQRSNIGLRVEGSNDTTPMKIVQYMVSSFGSELKLTTYKPCTLTNYKNVYMVQVRLKKHITYKYSNKMVQAKYIYITLQEDCQEDFSDKMKREPTIPKDKFIGWMTRVKNTLNYYHSHGGFHGDIKFENMVYCKTKNEVKIIDYPDESYQNRYVNLLRKDFLHSFDIYSRNGNNLMAPRRYDQICFNMILAKYTILYCTQSSDGTSSSDNFRNVYDVSIYNKLHYPAATKTIIDNEISSDRYLSQMSIHFITTWRMK